MARITPENVTSLPRGVNIAVGTNESGIHGAGIAKYAWEHWGLTLGQGFGPSADCFAIPTKDWGVETLPLDKIAFYVNRYIDWVNMIRNGRWTFYVTRIGCGLAGYTPKDIAPMFKSLRNNRNVYLPEDFIEIIGQDDPEEELLSRVGR